MKDINKIILSDTSPKSKNALWINSGTLKPSIFNGNSWTSAVKITKAEDVSNLINKMSPGDIIEGAITYPFGIFSGKISCGKILGIIGFKFNIWIPGLGDLEETVLYSKDSKTVFDLVAVSANSGSVEVEFTLSANNESEFETSTLYNFLNNYASRYIKVRPIFPFIEMINNSGKDPIIWFDNFITTSNEGICNGFMAFLGDLPVGFTLVRILRASEDGVILLFSDSENNNIIKLFDDNSNDFMKIALYLYKITEDEASHVKLFRASLNHDEETCNLVPISLPLVD